jgi:hypothetical protein
MQELQQINCIVGYLDEYDASALQESHLRAKLFSFPLQVREQLLMGLSVSAEKAILWRTYFILWCTNLACTRQQEMAQTASSQGLDTLIHFFFVRCEFASKARNLREPEKKVSNLARAMA